MKQKYVAYIVLPLAALALIGAGTAYANGFFGLSQTAAAPQQQAQNLQTRFQQEANLLGISVEDVKNSWAKGETLKQLALDHNITPAELQQKMQDQRKQQLQDYLNTLVSQGAITQAQADQRLNFINQQQNNSSGYHMGRMGHGMMCLGF